MFDEDPFATAEQHQLEELSEAVLDEEAEKARSMLPLLHDVLDDLAKDVEKRRCVGLIIVDNSRLAGWERRHGAAAFTTLMSRLTHSAVEAHGVVIRDDDTLCLEHPGGDSILLFLSRPRQNEGVAPSVDVEDVMTRFERHLLDPFNLSKLRFQQALDSISLGSALLLHNASVDPRREIYRAIRQARKNADVRYHETKRRRHRVVGHMIAHRNIETKYQPIFHLPQQELLGFEALSRAAARDADRLGVHLFVAAARAELDGELDQACRSLSVHRRPRMEGSHRLFINCLPPTFFDPNPELERLVDQWVADGLQTDQFVFEVTEQITDDQAQRIMPVIQRLRERGFLFALDDVGTGGANLKLLADLAPDYIKMDLTLTQEIDQSERKQALAQYLLELANKSGAQLIAEGIETEAELQTLIDLGVHLGQGYLLGKPRSASQWSDSPP